MDDEVIAHMRQRIEKCRRLARSMTDMRTIEALRTMAEEIEADVLRLEGQDPALLATPNSAEGGERPSGPDR